MLNIIIIYYINYSFRRPTLLVTEQIIQMAEYKDYIGFYFQYFKGLFILLTFRRHAIAVKNGESLIPYRFTGGI